MPPHSDDQEAQPDRQQVRQPDAVVAVGGFAAAVTPSESNGNDVNARNFGIGSALASLANVANRSQPSVSALSR